MSIKTLDNLKLVFLFLCCSCVWYSILAAVHGDTIMFVGTGWSGALFAMLTILADNAHTRELTAQWCREVSESTSQKKEAR
jgi:hypothetical protein